MKNDTGGMIAIMSLLLLGGIDGLYLFVIDPLNKQDKQNKIYEQVTKLADVDGVNGTTLEEWTKVYKELGLPFDRLNPPNPKDRFDLPTSKLEQYIKNHSK